MNLLLGCIADDSTGATDLANTLVKQGLPTVQVIGVPAEEETFEGTKAVVIALKSRTSPVEDAVSESTAALEWLQKKGARQFLFKYCSTFDSTDQGNIGPVAEALLKALGEDFTIACPAFPTNERTVYQGHLFVGEKLLSESGMEHHPLNPMKDPNLVRVLARQTGGEVALIPWSMVRKGSDPIRAKIEGLIRSGIRHAIVDAITDEDLMNIGRACANLKLLTGGSGVAMGLPENFRQAGMLEEISTSLPLDLPGFQAVLAGSCSQATLKQVAEAYETWPSFYIDAMNLSENNQTVEEVVNWVEKHLPDNPVMIYSSASADEVTRIQSVLGRDKAGNLIEDAMGRIAVGLVERGVRKLIVAGGETAGAVVKSLGVRAMHIGPEIDPGVPWCKTVDDPPILLALKSGNFGGENFFSKAFGMLP